MAVVLVNNSTDIRLMGRPRNRGAFFDGTRYWVIYNENATLKAFYGTALTSRKPKRSSPNSATKRASV